MADLINREDVKELPLTCSLRNNQLRNIITIPMTVPFYPANTQGVERVVKEVTAASASVFGFERHDGFIRARAALGANASLLQHEKDVMKIQSIING